MQVALSREQMRAFDQCASLECGVPSLLLMENAGRGAAEVIEKELAGKPDSGAVVVLCGPGNNGGDGFVVARRLRARGFQVELFLAGQTQKLQGDAAHNAEAFRALGGRVNELAAASELEEPLTRAGLIVDALLGTGLDRPVSGLLFDVIRRLNAARAPVVALDIPSGLDANTGSVLGAAVRAAVTTTFAHWKLGLLTTSGSEHAGEVQVVDIGVPGELHERVGHSAEVLETRDVSLLLRPRSLAAHKGAAGRVIALAGSAGKTGAALLVARGALRAGAGLVTLCAFEAAREALDRRVLEEMTALIDEARIEASLDALLENAQAVAVGPGIGFEARAKQAAEHVVLGHRGTIVVDADALTHFVGRASELSRAAGRLILTPHPAELGRLLGISTAAVEADRFAALGRCVDETRAVVLLKGPRTIVGAPGRSPTVNRSGTPALATGGSGDVLTGMIAALACSLEPFEAAYSAAHLHGLAAERWAAVTSADRGLLAHEIADQLPGVFGSLVRR